MKTKAIFSVASFALLAAMSPTLQARGGGGGGDGGGFSGGHFGGSGFHSGAFGGSGGTRYSFATRPMYGRPVYVNPTGGLTSNTRTTATLT